MKETAKDTD